MFAQFPWRIASVADKRLPERVRFKIANDAFKCKPCCLDKHFTVRVVQEARGPTDLLQPGWQSLLLQWARSVRLSAGQVEFQHAKNRSMAHDDMTWTTFAAMHTNSDLQRLALTAKRTWERVQTARSRGTSSCSPAPVAVPATRVPRKGLTGLGMFRKELLQRDKALHVNACSRETWQQVKSEWAALSPQQRAAYEDRSKYSRDLALEARMADEMQASITTCTVRDAQLGSDGPCPCCKMTVDSHPPMPPTFPEFAGDVWKQHTAAVGRPVSEQHFKQQTVPKNCASAIYEDQ